MQAPGGAPSPLKRAGGMLFRRSDSGDATKRNRSNSFNAESNVGKKLLEVYEVTLGVYAEVKKISLTHWSALDAEAGERIKFTRMFFEALVSQRNYRFDIHHPEGFNPAPMGSATQEVPDPSPPESEKKSLRNLERLIARLEKYNRRLLSTEYETFDDLVEYEKLLWEHYSKKIPRLPWVPRKEVKKDLHTSPPPLEFKLLSKIQTQINSEEHPLCAELFRHAQEIYDRYKAIQAAYQPFMDKVGVLTQMHDIYVPQLFNAKRGRRFQDEQAAQTHLDKWAKRCSEQEALYNTPNPRWIAIASDEGCPRVTMDRGASCGFEFTCASYKGGRDKPTIEDAILCDTFYVTVRLKRVNISLWGVFDGHGGATAAEFFKANLTRTFMHYLKESCSYGFTKDGILNAAKRTCLELHDKSPVTSGTTLVFAFVIEGIVYVANVGDSRAMILENKPRAMACDASPAIGYYKEQVKLRRGHIVFTKGMHRILESGLAVTRTMGDKLGDLRADKFQPHTPVFTEFKIPEKPNENIYLVLCSDGVTHVLSHLQLLEFIRAAEKNKISMYDFASSIIRRTAMHQAKPDGDDVSIIVVKLAGKAAPK